MSSERPTAVITGGSRGIGRATGERLAHAGYDLVLLSRDEARLAESAAYLATSGVTVRHAAVDLADDRALVAAVAGLGLDRVDALVHAAGIVHTGQLPRTTTEEFRLAFDVNVTAVASLTRELLPALKAARGRVVMLNSGSGKRANGPNTPIYVATKFALNGLAESLRHEFRPHGIIVSTVAPGRVDTDMQHELVAGLGETYDAASYLSASDVAAAIVHVLTQPGEIDYLSIRPPARG
ncbi:MULTISPECIES: SDR family NAD(P)-dependent oxidoreductase [unclassified Pseudactinotalea]|uniref:SDR family NAD(P)-dependent oxidoreductase n=1 Tax=unclassified Pseudactinotalea TaxID=2649176 RepID=UPI00128D5AEB|nr:MULTISPECIES: SDR family NAD(P)-dependent oxidoreductase [unclassified Pseudactinotalea]MPV49000.1 SDR family NAD(P)-dependent oxidoreductase [Pseudactinotalea sp. HY160]QGH68324.1 SDR family NAD(P)-dependent oxidoreductase [Pseudactinotalea sp. HY158]